MRAMKDSGIEWIGLIPQDWIITAFKRLGAPATGSTPSKDKPDYWDGEIPWLSSKDLKTTYLFDSEDHITDNAIKECGLTLFETGTLIFCVRSGILRHTFPVSVTMQPTTINQDLRALKPTEMATPSYLLYYLTGINDTIVSLYQKIGATVESIEMDWFSYLPVVLPSIEDQTAIVHYLNTKCAEIDALISAKEKTNALLKERRQSIIYEAVTKGLDPTAPMKDSGVEWIGEIPEDWSTIRAKYVATITNGCDPKTEGDIPVYGSGSDSFRTCGEFKEGPAVLIGRKGATLHIPHYVEGKYWNVDTAFDVKTDEEAFLLKFYYYAAVCFDYKLYISTTTLPGMTQTNYGNMFLPLPSTEEQHVIIKYLDNELKRLDELVLKNELTIQNLKEYRQSLIYEAVTGKIEV